MSSVPALWVAVICLESGLAAFVSEVFDFLELKHSHQCVCVCINVVLAVGIAGWTPKCAYDWETGDTSMLGWDFR